MKYFWNLGRVLAHAVQEYAIMFSVSDLLCWFSHSLLLLADNSPVYKYW